MRHIEIIKGSDIKISYGFIFNVFEIRFSININ